MTVTQFETRGGARVYQMPVETFPGHVNNIYLILDGDVVTLFDVGSGLPDSNEGLERRMAEVRERFGEVVMLASVQHVVISHAHIDHFGCGALHRRVGRGGVRARARRRACWGNFEEAHRARLRGPARLHGAGGRQAGAPDRDRAKRTAGRKNFFKSVEIDHLVRDRDRIINGYRVHHTPGHCPGRSASRSMTSCFTADHVLSRIDAASVAGRDHALSARLELVSPVARQGARARGHPRARSPATKRSIEDLDGRIAGIVGHTSGGSARCATSVIAAGAGGGVQAAVLPGWATPLLALEEAAPTLEYLFQRGELRIATWRP